MFSLRGLTTLCLLGSSCFSWCSQYIKAFYIDPSEMLLLDQRKSMHLFQWHLTCLVLPEQNKKHQQGSLLYLIPRAVSHLISQVLLCSPKRK